MDKFVTFICENYEIIILIAACLLDLILFLAGIFKKKKISPLGEVFKYIPKFVRYAEATFPNGHGQEKKDLVIRNCLELYKFLTGVEVTNESAIAVQISKFIEEVLDTPAKKGK